MGRQGKVGVSRENAEMVEVVGSSAIVAVRVLELAEIIQSVDLFECNLKRHVRWSDMICEYVAEVAIYSTPKTQEKMGIFGHSRCSAPLGTASFGSCPVSVLALPPGFRSHSRHPEHLAEASHSWREHFHASRRILTITNSNTAQIPHDCDVPAGTSSFGCNCSNRLTA